MAKEQHEHDTSSWSVSRAARAAELHRTGYLEDISAGTSVAQQVHRAALTPQYFATYREFRSLGRTPQDAQYLAVQALSNGRPMNNRHPLFSSDPVGYLVERAIFATITTMRNAEIYIADPYMTTQIIAAAHTIEPADLELWRSDDAPSRTGFLVFAKPVLFQRTENAEPDPLIGLSWDLDDVEVASGTHWITTPGITVSAWVDLTSTASYRDTYYSAAAEAARRSGERFPQISSLFESYVAIDAVPEDVRRVDSAVVDYLAALSGMATIHAIGEYAEDDIVSGKVLPLWSLSVVMAAMRLMAQEGQAQTRKYRDGIDPRTRLRDHHDVRVIRARHQIATSQAPTSRENQTHRSPRRHPVRMHKTRQHYKDGVVRVIWRGPFLRGGKANDPVLDGPKIHALTETSAERALRTSNTSAGTSGEGDPSSS